MRKALTIVSVTPFYGGGEEFILRLIKAQCNDFDIHVVCCSAELSKKAKQEKAQVHHINAKGVSRYLLVYKKLLKIPAKKQQALLLNGQGAGYLAPVIKRFYKKVIIVQHTSINYFNSPLKTWLVVRCFKAANTIICVSNFLKDELNEYMKGDIQVIYNWLPPTVVRSFEYNPDGDKLKVIYLGRLAEGKGIAQLIDAVVNLKNVDLLILGDGPLYESLKNKYSNTSCLTLAGWQNNKIPFFEKVHLNVVNSSSEGFSYSPVEAGVCGIPSLISDIGVHKEICDNGKFSFLFKQGSVEDLIYQISYLKNNRELLKEMSDNCKNHYINNFVLSNYKEAYKEVLS